MCIFHSSQYRLYYKIEYIREGLSACFEILQVNSLPFRLTVKEDWEIYLFFFPYGTIQINNKLE